MMIICLQHGSPKLLLQAVSAAPSGMKSNIASNYWTNARHCGASLNSKHVLSVLQKCLKLQCMSYNCSSRSHSRFRSMVGKVGLLLSLHLINWKFEASAAKTFTNGSHFHPHK